MSSETTELLGLPYIMPSQAQKHVTHNEALRKLDALIQLAVESRGFTAPPAEPAPGERHIIAAEATGAWSGREGSIAAWLDDQWLFMAPNTGWLVWIEDEDKLLVFSGAGWIDFAPASGASTMLGINTSADETNRFAVKSDAVLISHDDMTPGTGDMRLVVNKAAAERTASLVFQDDWSARAELGLAGGNDLVFKVSDDGTVWKDAIVVDRATARVNFPSGSIYRERLTAARTYYVRPDGNNGNDGLSNTSGGAFLTIQHAINIVLGTLDLGGQNVTIQCADGTYAGFSMNSAQTGAGLITVRGNTSTPANVTIDSTINLNGAGVLCRIEGFTLMTASGNCLAAASGALAQIGSLVFGASAGAHIFLNPRGFLEVHANYSISGGANRHFACLSQSQINISSRTITVSGTPAFSIAFCQAAALALVTFFSSSFSGDATGTRYSSTGNSVVNTGGGASFFPGNAAGTTGTGGLYM